MKKLSKTELIKAEIARLNESGSGDFQSLMRQVDGEYKTLKYNAAQAISAACAPHFKHCLNLWGRGTGKTTDLGRDLRDTVLSMPRSVGAFVAPSYKFFLTKNIPSLIQGLEMHGMYEDLHYFVGKKPPKSWKWDKPYQPPTGFEHFIWFYNGAGIHLISQDVKGDGRAFNLDYIRSDESALLSKSILDETVDPALRGSHRTAFEKSPYWGSVRHSSSMPTTLKGRWLFDMENPEKYDPKTTKVIKANCLVNLQNLMPGYLEDRKGKTIPWIFDAEYLNKRPKQVENGFYALLDEDKHGYTAHDYTYYKDRKQQETCQGDDDILPEQPLILGIDWGAVINSMVVCQRTQEEFRALKSMYVLGDEMKTQDDLADDFTRYYATHPHKVVFLWYDNTGNVRTGNTRRTRAQQFAQRLRSKGWTVRLMTKGGTNPDHDKKHKLWEDIFQETNPKLPRFRINTANARDLLVAMQNTQVAAGRNGETKKDKSSERRLRSKDRHLATDLTDAIDAPVYGIYRDALRHSSPLPEARMS